MQKLAWERKETKEKKQEPTVSEAVLASVFKIPMIRLHS